MYSLPQSYNQTSKCKRCISSNAYDLRDEIVIRNETIEQLQSNIKQMQVEHSRAMMNKDNEHRKALEAKEAEHKEETNILNSIINTAHRWYVSLR